MAEATALLPLKPRPVRFLFLLRRLRRLKFGRPVSLRTRLLAVSVVVLLGFVGLTGAVLDRAFQESADAAQSQRLEALLFLLMGAIDISPNDQLLVPEQLPESRLAVPGSGLYAAITQVRNLEQWQSNSTLGLDIPFADDLKPGQRRSEVREAEDGQLYRVVSQGVRWVTGDKPAVLVFSVSAPISAQDAEIFAYRKSLWAALGVMSLLLLVALIMVLTWGLRPLRVLARRLSAMEEGKSRDLEGRYPAELAPLVNNLNRLLSRERTQLERYRAAMGDLAHSLKTPLAVLRGARSDAELERTVADQVERMDQIVHYQLQRASTAGASQTAPPIKLAPLVDRLLATMAKVYAERHLQLIHVIADDLDARIDEGDAMELMGNLIDNACKWASSRVRVSAERSKGGLCLTLEDDGPGIADPDRVLGRGQRGDERTPGHGIGLAIIQDIALAYRGELRIDRSEWGGAKISVWLGQA